MVDFICNKLTLAMKINLKDIDDDKAEIINYGLKCGFSFITKTAIILLISCLLKILDLVLIVILSIGFYRTFAGGGHASTHIKCLLSSFFIIFGSVYLGKYIFFYAPNIDLLFILIFIFNCIVIYFYAPADVEQKPILSSKLREKLRILSAFSMSLIIIASITIIRNQTISNILVATTLIESITMLPFCYKILGCKYGFRKNSVSDVKQL